MKGAKIFFVILEILFFHRKFLSNVLDINLCFVALKTNKVPAVVRMRSRRGLKEKKIQFILFTDKGSSRNFVFGIEPE